MNSDETREALKYAIGEVVLDWSPIDGNMQRVKDALAKHEAAIKAEALREAASKALDRTYKESDGTLISNWMPETWSDQACGWLDELADRIESEARG